MGIIEYALIWLAISMVCALPGKNKPIGYGVTFLICILLSPVIGLIVGLIAKDYPPDPIQHICKNCNYASEEKNYYCPRCFMDADGFTAEQNKTRFTKPVA